MPLFVGHDLGTGGNKASLVDLEGRVLAEHTATYPLAHPEKGWAEQEPEHWWRAVVECTRSVVSKAGVSPSDVVALGFAGQMLSLVPLDREGTPTRRAISWMDARADEEARRMTRRLGGEKVMHLLAGAAPTGKDLVAKIAWIAAHEPAVHAKTFGYTDATGFLVARATGIVGIDPTAAGATGILDAKSRTWSRLLATLISFPLDKMPTLFRSIDVVGTLTRHAAEELGLSPSTQVAAGMADIPSAAVGSGALEPGDAHVYLGTSSWIGVTVRSPKMVPKAGIASVPAPDPSTCLLIGESETAGACREWFEKNVGVGESESLDALAARAEPGSGGVLFLPWMYGERSPVPDTRVRGAWVNVSLEHERAHLMRSLYEGVALNLRWILDECRSIGEPCPTLRAIGGGARSDLWLQILADVTERPIEKVAEPRQAGAVGAALVAAVATGHLPSVPSIKQKVRVDRRFEPTRANRAVYEEAYGVFRELHGPLSRAGRLLRSRPG
ncbi:MAG: FGGY-family carbohydrate kinase [Polyangiales bacterium]